MEKIIMERHFIVKDIPVWMWDDLPLIRIGKGTFVTAKPVATDVRSMGEAMKIATEFSEANDCDVTVTYDTEWMEVIKFLTANFGAYEFTEMNKLCENEVLLLDSMSEGKRHVLAGGQFHGIDNIFHGFISGDDADGEPQPKKLVFLTIRFELNKID